MFRQIRSDLDNTEVNAVNIAANASDITTNATNITTNANDIATNEENITANADDIDTNTDDIATNTEDIAAIDSGGATLTIFEVQSAATGDGLYTCYKQTLDATEWSDETGNDKVDDLNATGITVMNLLENNCEATYSPALAVGDLIQAWEWTDDGDTDRWVGIPLVSGSRIAITTAAAGASSTITANLYDRSGTAITSGLGSAITVNCNVDDGSDLNAAVPRLQSGKVITVFNQQGKWWLDTVLSGSESCICDEPT